MLILPDADGLGVNFHKLGERVLQAARDGHGRAEIHVVLRELFGGELACRVHGCARLGDDHVADVRAALVHPADQLNGHLFGLAAGGAVADGNVLHVVLLDELCQHGDGLVFLPLTVGRVDHGGIEHLARAVHDRDLAAHAVPRVKPHRDLALDRRLHQQRF